MSTIRRGILGLAVAVAFIVPLVTTAPAAVAAQTSGPSSLVEPAATCAWTVTENYVYVRWAPYVGAAVYAIKYAGNRVTGPCGVTYWHAGEQRLWQALYTINGDRVWIASEFIR